MDGLPPSGDKWNEAFGESYQFSSTPEPIHEECHHKFDYVSGIEAECINCHWGVYVDGRDEIKEGHVFRDGKQVI